ncbi:MAG: MFS transporter [Deltaproteobacteria bacterium]|nr:MAG: MFS transporter [Deltaproteobacteria bacterium]
MTSSNKKNKGTINRFQILVLFFLTAIFFINFTIRIIVSPLLPNISLSMGLTHDQGGSLFLISATGYFIALLCSGFVSSKIGHKKTIAFSAIAAGIAFIFTGLSPGLLSMRAGLFCVGMASALYLPSGIAILTSSIDQHNWGKAIGIHELAPNLSFFSAPLICEVILLWLPWRGVFFIIGGFSIFLGLSFFKFSHVNNFLGESPTLTAFLPLVGLRSFWIMIVLFTLGVIGTLGVYSMLPLFLVDIHYMHRSQANSLITMSRILTLPMPLFIGWMSDRVGLKPTLSAVLFLTGLSTLLVGVLTGQSIKIIIFCQPLLAVCFFPPAFAALSQIGSKKMQNVIISFTIPIAFLFGGGVVPNLIGILADHGLFSMGFIIFGCMICLGAVIPVFLNFHQDV